MFVVTLQFFEAARAAVQPPASGCSEMHTRHYACCSILLYFPHQYWSNAIELRWSNAVALLWSNLVMQWSKMVKAVTKLNMVKSQANKE